MADAHHRARPDPLTATAGAAACAILIVEDDPGLRALLEVLFADHPCELLVVATGEDALTVCAARNDGAREAPRRAEDAGGRGAAAGVSDEGPPGPPVALVIADVDLCGMSGHEVVRHVRARWPEVVCALMSGYQGDDVARQGTLAGVRFLQKPFRPDHIRSFVDEALTAARAGRPPR